MKLYHGTPNDFDAFDTEHIGSGEGHQVHGWGLYFAADKKIVTDRYAKRLAQRNTNIVITIDGVEYSHSGRKYDWIAETMSEMANNKAFDFNEYDVVKLLLLNHDWWDDTAKEHIEKNIRNYQAKVDAGEGDERIFISNDFPPLTAEESLKLNLDVLKYIEDHDVKYEIHSPKSSVFTIEVPDDLVFANEEELISNQPENVKNILYNYQKKRLEIAINDTPDYLEYIPDYLEYILTKWMDETIFGDWYDTYQVNDIYNDKDLSLLLESLGINGITYYGREDGRCYVVFNPNHIKIIEKEQI